MGLLHVSGSLKLELAVKCLKKSIVESQIVMSLVLQIWNRLLAVKLVEIWVNITLLRLSRLKFWLLIWCLRFFFWTLFSLFWKINSIPFLKVLWLTLVNHFLNNSFSNRFIFATNLLNLRTHLAIEGLCDFDYVRCFYCRIFALIIDFILQYNLSF